MIKVDAISLVVDFDTAIKYIEVAILITFFVVKSHITSAQNFCPVSYSIFVRMRCYKHTYFIHDFPLLKFRSRFLKHKPLAHRLSVQ